MYIVSNSVFNKGKRGREKPNIIRENNRLEGKTVESVILANFRLTDRVFYLNMIGKILVNLVQNRVMVSSLGSYDFVAWVKI